MDIFVKKTNTINIPVWAWVDSDGNVEATHDKAEVSDENAQQLTFTFRRPTYQDSTGIVRNAMSSRDGESLDVAAFQDTVLRSQMVAWDIKDEDGIVVPVNVTTVNELQPSVARAAVTGYLSKVKI